MAHNVIVAAKSVASRLNEGARNLAEIGASVDAEIKKGIYDLSTFLGKFKEVNDSIVSSVVGNMERTDKIDERNRLIVEIGKLLDVRWNVRSGDDAVLYLASGGTLFETEPRIVRLNTTSSDQLTPDGVTLIVDGAALMGGDEVGGRLGALLRFRNEVAPALANHLDGLAGALVAATAESNRTTLDGTPLLAGLFTTGSRVSLLPRGGAGLAEAIMINPNVDPENNGSLDRLRDGGISGNADYVYNIDGSKGYGDRLRGLADSLSRSGSFGFPTEYSACSIIEYATAGAGSFDQLRSISSQNREDRQALESRAMGAWRDKVGVDVDAQLLKLLELQRSYQASSRIIATINSMLDQVVKG